MILKRTLGFKLVLYLFFLVFFPLMVVSSFLFIRGKEIALQEAERHTAVRADDIGVAVERIIFSAFAHIKTLAENPVIKVKDSSLDEKLIEMVKIQDFFTLFEDITLIDLNGHVMASTAYEYRGNWLYKDWFVQAKAGNTVVSPVHGITFPFRLVVVVTAPVRSESGAIRAVISGQVNMERVWEITDNASFGESGFVFLTDGNANLIAYPDRAKLLKRLEPESLKEKVLGMDFGTFSYEHESGREKLCVFTRLEGYDDYPGQGWRIGIIQDKAEAMTVAGPLKKQSMLIAFGGGLILLVLLVLVRRDVVKPLQTLVKATERISGGDLNTRVVLRSHDELGSLGSSFNKMVMDLNSFRGGLIDEKERLAVTLRSLGEGVVTLDSEGRVALCNNMARSITGWSRDDEPNMPYREFFIVSGASAREELFSLIEDVLNGGNAGEISDTALLSKTDKAVLISGVVTPIVNARQEVAGAVVVFQDITEKRKMEEDLLKSQKLETLGVVAGGIAHDFNNMLMAILGNISIAKLELRSGASIGDLLEEAEKAAFRASNLTKQLLTFTEGGAPIKKLVDLSELVKESAIFVLRGSNSVCKFVMPPDLWMVEVDPEQMSQVVHNLAINADQAMAEGGTVTISAKNVLIDGSSNPNLAPGKYVEIIFADEGVGIPAPALSRIFDPYFTTKKKGTGLGLASVYAIVTRHGGHINAESNGRGATFTAYLPASTQGQVEVEEKKAPAKGVGRVLVMDDEESIRNVVKRSLTSLGFEAEVAPEGFQALKLFKKAGEVGKPFDVVILDLTVKGGMGGKETLEELRKIDPAVKAIVASGYSIDPIMANYREYGFQGVIPKPFTINALREALGGVLPVT